MTQNQSDSYSLYMPQVSTVRVNGPALRDLRTRRGLSVSQLAKKIGRHQQSVRLLETSAGKTASLVFAYQLANALGVELDELALADDEPEQDEDAA